MCSNYYNTWSLCILLFFAVPTAPAPKKSYTSLFALLPKGILCFPNLVTQDIKYQVNENGRTIPCYTVPRRTNNSQVESTRLLDANTFTSYGALTHDGSLSPAFTKANDPTKDNFVFYSDDAVQNDSFRTNFVLRVFGGDIQTNPVVSLLVTDEKVEDNYAMFSLLVPGLELTSRVFTVTDREQQRFWEVRYHSIENFKTEPWRQIYFECCEASQPTTLPDGQVYVNIYKIYNATLAFRRRVLADIDRSFAVAIRYVFRIPMAAEFLDDVVFTVEKSREIYDYDEWNEQDVASVSDGNITKLCSRVKKAKIFTCSQNGDIRMLVTARNPFAIERTQNCNGNFLQFLGRVPSMGTNDAIKDDEMHNELKKYTFRILIGERLGYTKWTGFEPNSLDGMFGEPVEKFAYKLEDGESFVLVGLSNTLQWQFVAAEEFGASITTEISLRDKPPKYMRDALKSNPNLFSVTVLKLLPNMRMKGIITSYKEESDKLCVKILPQEALKPNKPPLPQLPSNSNLEVSNPSLDLNLKNSNSKSNTDLETSNSNQALITASSTATTGLSLAKSENSALNPDNSDSKTNSHKSKSRSLLDFSFGKKEREKTKRPNSAPPSITSQSKSRLLNKKQNCEGIPSGPYGDKLKSRDSVSNQSLISTEIPVGRFVLQAYATPPNPVNETYILSNLVVQNGDQYTLVCDSLTAKTTMRKEYAYYVWTSSENNWIPVEMHPVQNCTGAQVCIYFVKANQKYLLHSNGPWLESRYTEFAVVKLVENNGMIKFEFTSERSGSGNLSVDPGQKLSVTCISGGHSFRKYVDAPIKGDPTNQLVISSTSEKVHEKKLNCLHCYHVYKNKPVEFQATIRLDKYSEEEIIWDKKCGAPGKWVDNDEVKIVFVYSKSVKAPGFYWSGNKYYKYGDGFFTQTSEVQFER